MVDFLFKEGDILSSPLTVTSLIVPHSDQCMCRCFILHLPDGGRLIVR